jgi:hypothetical protein
MAGEPSVAFTLVWHTHVLNLCYPGNHANYPWGSVPEVKPGSPSKRSTVLAISASQCSRYLSVLAFSLYHCCSALANSVLPLFHSRGGWGVWCSHASNVLCLNYLSTCAAAGVSLLAMLLEATMIVEGARGAHQLWPQALAPLRGPQSSVLRGHQ